MFNDLILLLDKTPRSKYNKKSESYIFDVLLTL